MSGSTLGPQIGVTNSQWKDFPTSILFSRTDSPIKSMHSMWAFLLNLEISKFCSCYSLGKAKSRQLMADTNHPFYYRIWRAKAWFSGLPCNQEWQNRHSSAQRGKVNEGLLRGKNQKWLAFRQLLAWPPNNVLESSRDVTARSNRHLSSSKQQARLDVNKLRLERERMGP